MARARSIEPEWLSADETAEVLGVDRTTVWRWARKGTLTKYHSAASARVVRFRRDEVDALMVAINTMEPAAAAMASRPRGKGGRREVVRKRASNGAAQ